MGERDIRITDLHELAAIAGRQLQDPTRLHPAFVPAHPAVRLAAGAADVAVAFCLGIACSCLVFGFFLVVLHQDFDGPPQCAAAADWLLFTWVGVTMLLYSAVEALGWGTPGKRMLGLLVVAAADPPRRGASLKRWALKACPLVVFSLVCLCGLVHTEWLGWERFDEEGWSAGREVVAASAVPGLPVIGAFLRCFGANRLATYDRLTSTRVVRPAYLPGAVGRAFEVLPAVATAVALAEPVDGEVFGAGSKK